MKVVVAMRTDNTKVVAGMHRNLKVGIVKERKYGKL